MEPYLSVRNLSFRYPEYQSLKNRPIFTDLSFSVEKGEIAVFLAPPESGKTTLSRIITGLVPRYTGGVFEGTVFIDNSDAVMEKPYNLIEKAGIVFQNPDEQILTQEVESELGFALEVTGFDHDFIKKKTEEALESAGIKHLSGMNPSCLSGGEKRKLLFGCLAAVGSGLWILDEIFEEIDPSGRISLLEYLKENNKTVLILTSKMLDIYKKYGDLFFLYTGTSLIKCGKQPDDNFIQKALECGVFLDSKKLLLNISKTAGKDKKKELLLKAENLVFKYSGSRFRLDIDDFYLNRGEVVVLLGKNGSGKSTLARLISGLLLPDSGAVMMENRGVLTVSDSDMLNRNTAYLFQNPDSQLFLPTVGEELLFGLKTGRESKEEYLKKAEHAVKLFRLESTDAPPAIMSYGARKRLQAAVYYLLEKKILVIDEADSGLSFNDYILILKNLKNLDPPPAVLVITHDIRLAAGIADRIVIMENGSISTGDTAEQVKKLLDISMAEAL